MTRHYSISRQLGLSLLELLVVMIIGVFIMMGITTVYIGNKTTSMTTDELSVLQANGRDVLQQLTEVIQHTGYKSTRSPLDSEMFILGAVAKQTCSGSIDSVVNPAVLGAVQNDTARGDTIGVVYLGDDLLKTDCTGSEIPTECRLSNTSATPIAASRIYSYFKADVNAQGTPVLTCGGSLSATEEEIAEGVENLQFSYGEDVDSDGTPDRFVNSDKVTNWGSIVSINVAVLMRSLNPVARVATLKKYKMLGDVNISTNDKYLRAVFTTTIRLRNSTS